MSFIYLSRLPYIKFPEPVDLALTLLEKAGYKAYVVGGAVRDLLREDFLHDWDITTDADPQAILAVFNDFSTYETGIAHGTVTVVIDEMPLEITTFRADGDYTDHRHPDSVVFTNDIEEDLARRDFTINAMALTREKELIDPFDGVDDLALNLIRAVGDPYKRFEEDALRIIRAFRFSATCLYPIEEETLAAATEKRSLLRYVSKERIDSEWKKLLSASFCGRTIVLLRDTGVMSEIFPELRPAQKILDSLDFLDGLYEAKMAALIKNLSDEETEAVFSHICPSKKEKSAILTIKTVANLLKDREWDELNTEPRLRVLYYQFGDSTYLAMRVAKLDGSISSETFNKINKISKENGRISSRSELAINGGDILREFDVEARDMSAVISALLCLVVTKSVANEKDELMSLVPNVLEKIKEDKTLDPENWRKKELYSLA